MKTYQILARTIGALRRCEQSGNQEWIKRHSERLDELMEAFPHGSGFDCGTKLDDSSTPERIVMNTSFHHMNDNGMYDGWTEHKIIITPSLESGYSLRITGPDRNCIKEMMFDYFHADLDADQPEYKPAPVQAQA